MEITVVGSLDATINDRSIQAPIFHMHPAKYSSKYGASNRKINNTQAQIQQNSLNIKTFLIGLLSSEVMGFKQPR